MTLALAAACVRRGGRAILDSVSLNARPGELLAIVGPNGAGKSTALAVLAGLIAPNDGRVTLDGRPMSGFGQRALALRRAMVSQSAQVAFPFRVHEVVAFGRAPHRGLVSARDDAAVIDAAIARFDLEGLADRDVTTLSGGERQRAFLARAFAQVWEAGVNEGESWLLLDEPTAALDPAHQIVALSAARQFARAGGGCVVILHDLRLAAAYADRVAVIEDGRLVTVAPPAEALTLARVREVFKLGEAEARLFLGADPVRADAPECRSSIPELATEPEPVRVRVEN